jgi:hypothetical protein
MRNFVPLRFAYLLLSQRKSTATPVNRHYGKYFNQRVSIRKEPKLYYCA